MLHTRPSARNCAREWGVPCDLLLQGAWEYADGVYVKPEQLSAAGLIDDHVEIICYPGKKTPLKSGGSMRYVVRSAYNFAVRR